MKPKKARKLRNALMIIGTAVMLLSFIDKVFFVIGAVITFSCLLPHFLFYKCPHCGKNLGRNEGDFCQYCGKGIDD